MNPPTPPWGVNRVKILRMKVEFMCKKKYCNTHNLTCKSTAEGFQGATVKPLGINSDIQMQKN